MPRFRTIILLLLVSCVSLAQEITLEGPDSPSSVGCTVEVKVFGLKNGELFKATIWATPEDGVVRLRRGVIEGQDTVMVEVSKPNKYVVNVGFNTQHSEWRELARKTHSAMLSAGPIGDLLERQKKIIDDSAARFPTRSGSTVVEVIGQHVPPDDDPDDPPPPGPTDFENAVKELTVKTIRSGGTTSTALAISDVFDNTASSVESGMIPFSNALPTASQGIKKVFTTHSDERNWTEFRTNLNEAFDTLRQDGEMATKEQVVGVFREIARGMSRAVNE